MPRPLNTHEVKVLKALAQARADYDGFGFLNFAGLSSRTRLNRKEVRRAARYLKRRGFAEFGRGLWTEDGEPAGSGYGCTREGMGALMDAD